MLVKELTPEEWELIETLRNYRKAYPNGNRMMIAEINDLVDILTDVEYQETSDKDTTE